MSKNNRILIFEWLCGGGCWLDDVCPDSCKDLLVQGRQMLQKLVADFVAARFEVLIAVDRRLEIDLGTRQFDVSGGLQLPKLLAHAASQSDWLLFIAPETNGRLAKCLGWVVGEQQKWLNADLELVTLASNKNLTQEFLSKNHVAIAEGDRGDRWAPENGDDPQKQLVVKLSDGCGGEDNRLLTTSQLQFPENLNLLTEKYRIEEFVAGESVSVGVFGFQGEVLMQPPQRQIFANPPVRQFSHCASDLSEDLSQRATQLARQVLATLPQFNGYVGIDMVLAGNSDHQDVVVEINPRVTVSYGSDCSPAKWLAEQLQV